MTITRTALVLVGTVFLGGCGLTLWGDTIRDTVAAKGADAMDKGVSNAEWFLCQGASIGAVRRAYDKPGIVDAYRTLCNQETGTLFAP